MKKDYKLNKRPVMGVSVTSTSLIITYIKKDVLGVSIAGQTSVLQKKWSKMSAEQKKAHLEATECRADENIISYQIPTK